MGEEGIGRRWVLWHLQALVVWGARRQRRVPKDVPPWADAAVAMLACSADFPEAGKASPDEKSSLPPK